MSLKVFDLQCSRGHVFEGWFGQHNSFEKQASQGLLTCPVCGDEAIERKLSAPRLNLGKRDSSGQRDGAGGHAGTAAAGNQTAGVPQLAKLQGKLLQHIRTMVHESEDVGPRFAQEALKIHHGQAQERLIRGTATPDEQRELLDEGVQVMAVPDFLKDDQLQ